MHLEILNKNQAEILPFLKEFSRSYYLVGGTAIALHLGHRRSIDFDLFTLSKINKTKLKAGLSGLKFNQIPIFEDYDQLHLIINNVKLTFFSYPFNVSHPLKVGSILSMPTLLSLSAMKAFALGRRAKWKDYVDLYFIIKNYYSIKEISDEASLIYGSQFSEKLFRQQLAFHKDINYSEEVEFLCPPVSDAEIKDFLINKATDIL
jgi:hypothetical protein